MSPESAQFMGSAISRLACRLHVNYVQVGANDGRTNDRLYYLCRQLGWNVLLIEASPDLIPALQRNYRSHRGRVVVVEAAVATNAGEAMFYYYPEEVTENPLTPGFAAQVGSLSHDLVADRPDIRAVGDPVATLVRTVQLHTVVQEADFLPVDLLTVDIEGDDDVAVSQMLSVCRPDFIMYEHCLLQKDRAERLRQQLVQLGYRVQSDCDDTFCRLGGEPGAR
jgi:FkbM family methyltransferase